MYIVGIGIEIYIVSIVNFFFCYCCYWRVELGILFYFSYDGNGGLWVYFVLFVSGYSGFFVGIFIFYFIEMVVLIVLS